MRKRVLYRYLSESHVEVLDTSGIINTERRLLYECKHFAHSAQCLAHLSAVLTVIQQFVVANITNHIRQQTAQQNHFGIQSDGKVVCIICS